MCYCLARSFHWSFSAGGRFSNPHCISLTGVLMHLGLRLKSSIPSLANNVKPVTRSLPAPEALLALVLGETVAVAAEGCSLI